MRANLSHPPSHSTVLTDLVYGSCRLLSLQEEGQEFQFVQHRLFLRPFHLGSHLPTLWSTFHSDYIAFYSVAGQSTTGSPNYSTERTIIPEAFHRLPKCRSLLRACAPWKCVTMLRGHSSDFLPLQAAALLVTAAPNKLCCWSPRFYPPVCYQLSQAEASSLLRIHLPPHYASFPSRVSS